MRCALAYALLASACYSCTQALPAAVSSTANPPVTTIFNFDTLSSPENIALRQNGQLLVTCLTCPHLSQIDPNQGPDQVRRIVHTFGDGLSVTGIAEIAEDMFAVNVGPGISLPEGNIGPGLNTIWTVNLAHYKAPDYDPSSVVVRKVASGGSAVLIDAMAVINPQKGLLAGTDIIGGALYLIDIQEGMSSVLSSEPLAFGRGGTPRILPSNRTSTLTANGVKYHDGKVYFTNTVLGLLGYISVDSDTGAATGPATTVYNYLAHGLMLDDFSFAKSANIYMTTLTTPIDGGIYRRKAGAVQGEYATEQILSRFGTNAVLPVDDGQGGCTLIFSAVLTSQVFRASLPGPC